MIKCKSAFVEGMRVKLKDVCTFYTGTGFPKKYQGQLSGTYPFYKVGDIANNVVSGKVYLEQCNNYISEETLELIKGSIIPKNTIVFAKIGEALKLNRRAITSTDCLIDNNAMGIAAKSDKLRTLFFYYFMRNIKMELLAESTTVPSVRKSRLEAYEIDIPSLDEQKIIEGKLTILSKVVNLKEKQLLKLDELVKARFVEMFGDLESNSMNWEKSLLANKLNVIGGYAFRSSEFNECEGIPVLRIGNINSGYFKPVNMVYWKENPRLSKYEVYPGDLVMSLTGTVGKDDYGNVCILGNEYGMYYLNQRNAKLEIVNGLNKYYLTQLLKFSYIKDKLTGINRGVRQANISNKDILDLVVPVPPLELQNRFASFAQEVDKSRLLSNRSLFLTKSIIF